MTSRREKRRVLKGHKSLASQKASLTQANPMSRWFPLLLQKGMATVQASTALYKYESGYLVVNCNILEKRCIEGAHS